MSGRDGLLGADPLDGLVGDVVVEVVVRVAQVRLDGLGPVEDRGPPLAGLGPDEPVELFEAQAGRPEIERSGLAVLPVGHVVVLAEPGGVPALLLEDFGDGGGVLAHQAVVAGEAGGQFHDVAGMHRVVVAAGEQRRARGRRDRRGVELRVAQPVLGQLVQRRRVAGPAEGARRAEADVIEEDDDDIGSPLGRLDRLRKIRLRVFHAQPDLPLERGRAGSEALPARRRRR